MARALIVGCRCRGRALGLRLREGGWRVRGTTRDAGKAEEISAAGLEGAVADPNMIGTLLDQIADVTLVFWLMGTATGNRETVAALHGRWLDRLLQEAVDTPVRGLVYEAAGSVPRDVLACGEAIVKAAAERWRIPVAIIDADPGATGTWLDAMVGAADRLTGARRL